MSDATTQFHNRIGLVFDFDETLAPKTTPKVFEYCGYDYDEFTREHVDPLVEDEGWEPPLASAYALSRALKRDGKSLTERELEELGADHPLFDGVPDLFGRVRERASEAVDGIEVEFYLVTAGFAEVPSGTPIASEFTAIYGGAYHFDEDGCVDAAKRVITHHEKTLYLMAIAKGMQLERANPNDVFEPRDHEDWSMPIDQMIFVGDGSSDMPAFKFMREHGGIGIGVTGDDDPTDWEQQDEAFSSRRVENLAPAGYGEGSELLESILLAVDCITSRISLRKLGRGE